MYLLNQYHVSTILNLLNVML